MRRLLPALALLALISGSAQAHWVDKHVEMPLRAWWCGSTNAACTQATQPNIDNIGDFDTLEWAAGENTHPVTIQVTIPDPYVGMGEISAYFAKDATTSDDDTVQLQWATGGDGDAVNPGLTDEGSQSLPHTTTISRITWDIDGATPAADDVLHVHLQRSAGANENVHLLAVYMEYHQ